MPQWFEPFFASDRRLGLAPADHSVGRDATLKWK